MVYELLLSQRTGTDFCMVIMLIL